MISTGRSAPSVSHSLRDLTYISNRVELNRRPATHYKDECNRRMEFNPRLSEWDVVEILECSNEDKENFKSKVITRQIGIAYSIIREVEYVMGRTGGSLLPETRVKIIPYEDLSKEEIAYLHRHVIKNFGIVEEDLTVPLWIRVNPYPPEYQVIDSKVKVRYKKKVKKT